MQVDPRAVAEVIFTLVVMREYSPEGTRLLVMASAPRPLIKIAIEDQGKAPHALRERVSISSFARRERRHHYSRQPKGTGMGLASPMELLKRTGAHLDEDAKGEAGTRVVSPFRLAMRRPCPNHRQRWPPRRRLTGR